MAIKRVIYGIVLVAGLVSALSSCGKNPQEEAALPRELTVLFFHTASIIAWLSGAVCGDGPYDPVATLDQYIASGKLFMPVAAALLLKGAIDTDPRLKALGCTYEDFCPPECFSWSPTAVPTPRISSPESGLLCIRICNGW